MGLKITVLGIDGLPHFLLLELIEKGIMPNMGAIVKKGCLGPMLSTVPELSNVAWTSIFTGVAPEIHGITGFYHIDPVTMQLFFPDSGNRHSPALWEMGQGLGPGAQKWGQSGENGRGLGIGLGPRAQKWGQSGENGRGLGPGPGRKNGAIMPGWARNIRELFAHGGKALFDGKANFSPSAFFRSAILGVPGTWPASTLDGMMIAGFPCPGPEMAYYPGDFQGLAEGLNYQAAVDLDPFLQNRELMPEYLLKLLKNRKKVIELVLKRENWDLFVQIFSETDWLHHFLFDMVLDEKSPFNSKIMEIYSEIDNIIGMILDNRGDNSVFVASDHGFALAKKQVNINNILVENGLYNGANLSDLDRQSTAFALEPGRIYLHKKGLFPRGGLGPEKVAGIMTEIKAIFSQLEYDGQRVIREIHTFEDDKSRNALMPHIILVPNKGFGLRAALSKENHNGTNGGFSEGAFDSKGSSGSKIWPFFSEPSHWGYHTRDQAFFATTEKMDFPEDFDIIDGGKILFSYLQKADLRSQTFS